MARNAQIAVSRVGHDELVFTFADGQDLRIDAGKLTNDIRHEAIMHGLKQKIGDAAAIGRNPETGRSATLSDKRAAMRAVVERLQAGAWNAERGEGGAPAGGLLFAALVRMYAGKKSDEDIRTFLAGKDDKQKAALRKNPRVAEIIEQIKAERAASGDDGEEPGAELLDELDGLDADGEEG
jgi:hypothetical protein